jgi:hypothetical protein
MDRTVNCGVIYHSETETTNVSSTLFGSFYELECKIYLIDIANMVEIGSKPKLQNRIQEIKKMLRNNRVGTELKTLLTYIVRSSFTLKACGIALPY